MISFLLFAGHSSGRLLMKNSQFFSPDRLAQFDRNLKSLPDSKSTLPKAHGHVDKDVVQCDQEIRLRSSSSRKSATNENKSSFRLSPSALQKTKRIDLSASIKDGASVFNNVTPSGPSSKVNSMVTKQQLSTISINRSGVGHMQTIHHKYQARKVDILKSYHSSGDHKSSKRKLGSTPSPGVGNWWLSAAYRTV